MQHSFQDLPENYKLIREVDMQKDKKTAVIINGLAAAVMVIMGFAMNIFIPISKMFDMSQGMGNYILRFAVLIIGFIGYIVLHELTHAAVMKHFGAKDVKFGYTGLYAFAGSPKTYFDRHSYVLISLAPLVVWGVIFTVLCLVSGPSWFWIFWLLQIGNVSGAAGDVYITCTCLKIPDSILINDDGVSMRIYGK